MTPSTPELNVTGFSLLRILSDREHSKVYLARDSLGQLCALKLQRPTELRLAPIIRARYERLQPLTRKKGFVTILAHGLTEDGWIWESLAPADTLPGLPPLHAELGIEQYTPLTLRAWSTEHGSAPTELAAR